MEKVKIVEEFEKEYRGVANLHEIMRDTCINGIELEKTFDRIEHSIFNLIKKKRAGKFINDLGGFIMWCKKEKKKANYIMLNIAHDVSGFLKDGLEDWFSPRTCGYGKYLI